MASKKETGAAVETAVPKEPAEPLYTADEFAAAAETVFGKGITPDLVRAAFARAGVKELSRTEAKKLVNNFAKKEVTR